MTSLTGKLFLNLWGVIATFQSFFFFWKSYVKFKFHRFDPSWRRTNRCYLFFSNDFCFLPCQLLLCKQKKGCPSTKVWVSTVDAGVGGWRKSRISIHPTPPNLLPQRTMYYIWVHGHIIHKIMHKDKELWTTY